MTATQALSVFENLARLGVPQSQMFTMAMAKEMGYAIDADSEIGVIMSAGHPCYFIGFSPFPEEGQTIEAVMRGEGVFLKKVIDLHPEADGKPVIIGNCQAGWAMMMLASTCPDLCGPIIAAGSPLSYWAGVRGANCAWSTAGR